MQVDKHNPSRSKTEVHLDPEQCVLMYSETSIQHGKDLGRGVLIINVDRLEILVNFLRVNSRAKGTLRVKVNLGY